MNPKRKKKKLSQILQNRWLPSSNTRAKTFIDKKKQISKKACRGKHIER